MSDKIEEALQKLEASRSWRTDAWTLLDAAYVALRDAKTEINNLKKEVKGSL